MYTTLCMQEVDDRNGEKQKGGNPISGQGANYILCHFSSTGIMGGKRDVNE